MPDTSLWLPLKQCPVNRVASAISSYIDPSVEPIWHCELTVLTACSKVCAFTNAIRISDCVTTGQTGWALFSMFLHCCWNAYLRFDVVDAPHYQAECEVNVCIQVQL